MLRKILLGCGIVSSVLYVVTDLRARRLANTLQDSRS